MYLKYTLNLIKISGFSILSQGRLKVHKRASVGGDEEVVQPKSDHLRLQVRKEARIRIRRRRLSGWFERISEF